VSDITFANLVEIYRATRFDGDDGGVLTVSSEQMAANLRAIMDDNVKGAKPRALRRARQRSWAGPGCWAPLRSEGGRRDNPRT